MAELDTRTGRRFRVVAFLWTHFCMLLTSWWPDCEIFMRLRGFLLRPAFKKAGSGIVVARNVHFGWTRSISLGNNVYLANGAWLVGSGGLTIDDEVMVGPYTVIIPANHTKKNGSYRFGALDASPIHIGAGAWIGAHVIILKGTEIGKGTVVSAGTVVSGTIPDDSMVVGVPGRIITMPTGFSKQLSSV